MALTKPGELWSIGMGMKAKQESDAIPSELMGKGFLPWTEQGDWSRGGAYAPRNAYRFQGSMREGV